MADDKKKSQNLVLKAKNKKLLGKRSHAHASRVISAEKANFRKDKVRIIGGDSDDMEQNVPPAIILEKFKDQIAKIIVKCPCGRHAELVCEYDEEEEPPEPRE